VRVRPSCLAIYNKELPSPPPPPPPPTTTSNGTLTEGAELEDMDLTAIWNDYLVFTVVRNPLTRLLSAHGFELGFIRAECEEAKDLVRWSRYSSCWSVCVC